MDVLKQWLTLGVRFAVVVIGHCTHSAELVVAAQSTPWIRNRGAAANVDSRHSLRIVDKGLLLPNEKLCPYTPQKLHYHKQLRFPDECPSGTLSSASRGPNKDYKTRSTIVSLTC